MKLLWPQRMQQVAIPSERMQISTVQKGEIDYVIEGRWQIGRKILRPTPLFRFFSQFIGKVSSSQMSNNVTWREREKQAAN